MDGDVCWAGVGVGETGDKVGRFQEDILRASTSPGERGDCFEERVKAVADGVVGGSFVVVATVKQMVAVGVDGLTTFAGGGTEVGRDDRKAQFALEHCLENVIG